MKTPRKPAGAKRGKEGELPVRQRRFTRMAHDPGGPPAADAVLLPQALLRVRVPLPVAAGTARYSP